MENSRYKILIVDDDPDISMMLKLMLEFKGYTVNTTDRPEETHSILGENTGTDLVIMDMLLSGVNGTDICTQLKQSDITRHIPVLMISAHPNAKEICLQAGADDFISKPFDMQDILSKINSLVKK